MTLPLRHGCLLHLKEKKEAGGLNSFMETALTFWREISGLLTR